MICLGIESTAHTFGIGIVTDDKQVLANERELFTTEKGGMIPAKVADHHVEICDKVIKLALDKVGLKLSDIDVIAFSQAPGQGHALRVGAFIARYLSLKYKKPLVGVNHCIAHLEVGNMLTDAKDPLLLYVSGVNTQVIAYDAGKYRIFGETLDIGVGNFLDSFARYIGLGFPGGPKVEEMALNGKNLVDLPYSVKGMDINLGGILTNLKQKFDSGKYTKEDLCYSLQEYVFAMLIETAERALVHCDKKELLLGGGVACNKRLQEMAKLMCEERKAKCYILPNQFNIDNGAMIAWCGLKMNKAGISLKLEDSRINPYERTDDVNVIWK
tara:strand:+ start:295 stop:1278 length:984 start_codon:yes stop_codon:yes gene_type:complete